MGENWRRKVKERAAKVPTTFMRAPGIHGKNGLRRTSQKDSQKHLNFKNFRPTISRRTRERAGR